MTIKLTMALVAGLALAIAGNPTLASLTTEPTVASSQSAAKARLPMVACRIGQVWYDGGVFPVYGERGGRPGVIDVIYVDPGCYWEY